MPESYEHNPQSHSGYLIHRRASKACQSCRERKIRCDVTLHGVPCQNCRNSDVSCEIVKCRRGKKHKEWYSRENEAARARPPPRHVEAFLDAGRYGTSIDHEKRPSNEASRNTPSTLSALGSNCDFVSTSIVRLGDLLGVHLLEKSMVPLSPPETDTSIEDLPSCFRPFPTHLEDSDIEYARSKGAFCVPHDRFRNEIIRSYLGYVHWYIPVVDTDELLQFVDGGATDPVSSGYSFLLFQCIMFAAVGFVNEGIVKEAGYENLKVARKAFYHRAKLLYDLDFEQDSLVLVQCLLLMSLWSEKPEGHKESWHWAGIAVSIAQTKGLCRNPDSLQVSPAEKSLRKRVWWCCFMRDRLLSLGIGRPMRIRDDEFDVPLLTLQDFEAEITLQQPSIFQHSQNAQEGNILWNRTIAEQLAEIFIAKVKLCMTVGVILSTQYTMLERSSRSLKRDAGSFSSVLLFPISIKSSDMTTGDEDGSLRDLEAELTEWHDALPRALQLSRLQIRSMVAERGHDGVQMAQGLQRDDHPEPAPCMLLQCALLHMSYHAAVSILHRPRSASAQSRAKVAASATTIANICTLLNAEGLACFLPTNAIPMLLASIVSKALLIKSTALKSNQGHRTSSTEQKRQEVERARDNVSELLVSLTSLRQVYFGADSVWTLVEALLARLGLRIALAAPLDREMSNRRPGHRSFEVNFMILNTTDSREQVFAGPKDNCHPPRHSDGMESGCEISPPSDLPSMHLGASPDVDARLFDTCTTPVNAGACHSAENDDATWNSMLDTLDYDSSVPTQIAVDWDGIDWSGTDWETLDLDWPA